MIWNQGTFVGKKVEPEGHVIEIDSLIGLAKANDRIRDYLVGQVFDNFEEQLTDLFIESHELV